MRFGIAVVPKYCPGSATGPPAPRSAAVLALGGASKGVKKSIAFSVPSGCTSTRATDWPRLVGGWLPGMGDDGLPPLPNELPVAKKLEPGRLETTPPPDIQMPAPDTVESPARVLHSVRRLPEVE